MSDGLINQVALINQKSFRIQYLYLKKTMDAEEPGGKVTVRFRTKNPQ